MIQDLEGEIWKDIPDFNGLYKISNFGRVASFKTKNSKILKCQTDSEGYKTNIFKYKKVYKVWKIHRLVLFIFDYRSDYNELTVNHKDFNKKNNEISNLEWCTNAENYNHYYTSEKYLKGNLSPQSKLKEKDIPKIRQLFNDGYLIKNIAKIYNVTYTAIYFIIKKENWKHI